MTTHPALQFELDQIEKRFVKEFERLKELAVYDNNRYNEIIYRILSCRADVLYDAIGAQGQNGYGHMINWETGPLSRMEFLTFFVAHELLDDGDPGVGWHKYDQKEGTMKPCAEDERRSKPFWHCCHEILPPGSKHLYEDEVIWVLDWHENYEERYYKDFGEQRKPEDPMLIELAKSITGR